MTGRYGVDELNRFLMVIVAVFLILNLFFSSRIWYLVSIPCLLLCYYRMFSKNISARFTENQKYLKIRFQVKEKLGKWKLRFQQMRQYHIYKCPNCGQKIRIPRGKGKISIHCRKCGTEFIKRS